jgi:predicted nucleic acid-binding protein
MAGALPRLGKRETRRQELANAVESFTSAITLAEVVSTSARRGRPVDDKTAVIRSQSKVVVPSSDDAIGAGLLHAEMKKASNFSPADAFVLQLARKVGARVVTGDPDFRGVKEPEFIQ